jgi:hypothetical protein
MVSPSLPSSSLRRGLEKTCIFLPRDKDSGGESGSTPPGGGAARSAFGAGRKETRLALAAAVVALPEGLSPIREQPIRVCPLPRISARRSPPPRT